MTGGALGRSDDPMGVERVAFFSDAVFAIAITLLVIELTVPEGELTEPQLTHELGRLGPKFFSFGLSFWVIGRFWVGHHLTFQYLRRWNLPMLWINLLLLVCIAFLPFPTAVLGNHLDLPVAVRLYAASVTVTGLASTLLWWCGMRPARVVWSTRTSTRGCAASCCCARSPPRWSSGCRSRWSPCRCRLGWDGSAWPSYCGCCWSRRSG
jgi:uncharacterized membrane protein